MAIYNGTAGNDTLDGSAGRVNDTLNGGLGNDLYRYRIGSGNDVITDTGGLDTLLDQGPTSEFSGWDIFRNGNDLVIDYNGNGSVTVKNQFLKAAPVVEKFAFWNGWGPFTFSNGFGGTSGNDFLVGTTAAESITGGAGSDVIMSGGGNDTISGGAGNDDLHAGSGSDMIDGGAGMDSATYWSLAQGITVNMSGEVQAGLASGHVSKVGGGEDVLTNIETVQGTSSDDIFYSGRVTGGDASWNPGWVGFLGFGGNDTFYIGGGGETSDCNVAYWNDPARVIVNLGGESIDVGGLSVASMTARDGTGATDTFVLSGNRLGITGSIFNDYIKGQDHLENWWLEGHAGNDTIVGGDLQDTAGYSDDGRYGAIVNLSDVEIKVSGVTGDTGKVTVNAHRARDSSGGIDTLISIESAAGTSFNDYLVASDEAAGLYGNAGKDTLIGGAGDDDLEGGAGADSLTGGAGDDWLDGGAGADSLAGGAGNDQYVIDVAADVVNETLVGSGGMDQVHVAYTVAATYVLGTNIENARIDNDTAGINLTGNALDNQLTGNGRANLLNGGLGDDILYNGGGNDTLIGGAGNDGLIIMGETEGNITLDGGAGEDWAQLKGVQSDYAITRPTGTQLCFTHLISGATIISSNVETFHFWGGVVVGMEDLNIRIGSPDDDNLTGSGGDDTLAGGLGKDSLRGGLGNDDLQGGAGNDTLIGGVGNDLLDGGLGSDTYQFSTGDGDDVIDQNDTLAGSIDVVLLTDPIGGPGTGETSLSRGWYSHDDLVISVNSGNPGAEVVDHLVVSNFFSNDLVNAGGAIDQIRFAGSTLILSQAQILSELLRGTDGDDWLRGYANSNDSLSGGKGDDILGGAAGNDTLIGGMGSDQLYGDGGADSLDGSAGNDLLYGGEGNDILTGGADDDTLAGGAGNDTYRFGSGYGNDVITDLGLVSDIDTLRFTDGTRAANVGVARSGDDLVVTVTGGDQLRIGDYFNASGTGLIEQFSFNDGTRWSATAIRAKVLVPTPWNDEITGYLGSESLQGLGGNDTINGGAGNDTINGGDWADLLTGGAGADHFVFNSDDALTNIDTITDFVSGVDKIDLSASIFTGLSAVGGSIGLGDQLLYNNATGALSYDADGSGDNVALTFAILGTASHPADLGTDFRIVA